jgi:hypothetical protein
VFEWCSFFFVSLLDIIEGLNCFAFADFETTSSSVINKCCFKASFFQILGQELQFSLLISSFVSFGGDM